jgi:hypothetical protein
MVPDRIGSTSNTVDHNNNPDHKTVRQRGVDLESSDMNEDSVIAEVRGALSEPVELDMDRTNGVSAIRSVTENSTRTGSDQLGPNVSSSANDTIKGKRDPSNLASRELDQEIDIPESLGSSTSVAQVSPNSRRVNAGGMQ